MNPLKTGKLYHLNMSGKENVGSSGGGHCGAGNLGYPYESPISSKHAKRDQREYEEEVSLGS